MQMIHVMMQMNLKISVLIQFIESEPALNLKIWKHSVSRDKKRIVKLKLKMSYIKKWRSKVNITMISSK